MVEIGKKEQFHQLSSAIKNREVIQNPIDNMKNIVKRLDDEDLTALIKSLTIAGNYRVGIMGRGSVSSVIWLFRELNTREHLNIFESLMTSSRRCIPATIVREFDRHGKTKSEIIADWVLKNARNDCIPFGRVVGFRSIKAMRGIVEYDPDPWYTDELIQEKHLNLMRMQTEQAQKRIEQRKIEAEKHAIRSAENRKKREYYIRKLKYLSPTERLKEIISCSKPITYFPDEFAVIDENTIKSINSEMYIKLIKRLKIAKKGNWKKLKLKLKQG